MVVYIKVTQDEYELIEAMADSVPRLAQAIGATPESIYQIMSHAKKRGGRCIYQRVEIGDIDG